jgi:hypothetical protein
MKNKKVVYTAFFIAVITAILENVYYNEKKPF